jgi:hypothetical protein
MTLKRKYKFLESAGCRNIRYFSCNLAIFHRKKDIYGIKHGLQSLFLSCQDIENMVIKNIICEYN